MAVLLLAMSVASWVVILWKAWLLRRAARDVSRSTAAFWQSASVGRGPADVGAFDREALVLPLIAATQLEAPVRWRRRATARNSSPACCATPCTRCSTNCSSARSCWPRVGSTAPFVGLLGTVWGIYHALTGIATAGQITIDKVAGPVGEALIMTAAGLAVAIPAVLGYNVFGRLIGRIEADLEGFARDLRELLTHATVPREAT